MVYSKTINLMSVEKATRFHQNESIDKKGGDIDEKEKGADIDATVVC